MINGLNRAPQDDLDRDVIAKWHDESQMNKFFAEQRRCSCNGSTICIP